MVPTLKVLNGKYLDIILLLSILQIFHTKDKQQNLHLYNAYFFIAT